MQASYVIYTSDAFSRRKRKRPELPKLAAQRSQKFYIWYKQHDDTMIPPYAAAVSLASQHMS